MLKAITRGSETEKVCVTAFTLSVFGNITGYAIYVVDVSNPFRLDCPSLNPVLELDKFDFSSAAVVVLGTKLYVFGGLDKSNFSINDDDDETCPYFVWKSHAYAFDIEDVLLSSPMETRKLHKTSAYRRLPMGAIKAQPCAAVIDDHRICVFSARLGDNPQPNFELFDTRDESFTPLPEAPNSPRVITSFFVARSTLIVRADDHELYRLRFDHPDPQWEAARLDVPESHRFNTLGLCVARGAFTCNSALCSPFEVLMANRRPPITYPIPLKAGGDKELICASGGMSSDERLVYIARAGKTDSEQGFFLCVDLLRFDRSLESHAKPINFCSLRFSVKPILVDGCYPVKAQGAVKASVT